MAFLCALEKIPIFFHLDNIADFVISAFKRTEFAISFHTHIMCQRHQQPIPSDSLCRTDLVTPDCQGSLFHKIYYIT